MFVQPAPMQQPVTPLPEDPWFSGLSASQQAALWGSTRPRKLAGGAVLWAQHKPTLPASGFAVLAEGLLKMSSVGPSGAEAVLGYIYPGQWFGESAWADGLGHVRDITAERPSVIHTVSPERMEELMADTGLARKLLQLQAERNRFAHSVLEDFSLRSLKARTARRLMLLACRDNVHARPEHLALDVSHDALASMLGVTRQSLSVQLRSLRAVGAIAQGYSQIVITSLVTPMVVAAAP